jgi:hypothetical protein
VLDQRIVIYVSATPEQILAARSQGMSEEDFGVVADDLMFYHATAIEYLEKRSYPLLQLEGRRPLRFRVGDAVRTLDFADVELFDFIVTYEPGREPRIIAPNEVENVAAYFGDGN